MRSGRPALVGRNIVRVPHVQRRLRFAAPPPALLSPPKIWIFKHDLLLGESRKRSAAKITAAAAAADASSDVNGRSDGRLPAWARHQPQLRAALDNEYLLAVVWNQKKRLAVAGACLLFCVASNLASPVLTGYMFELLVKQSPAAEYGRLLGLLAWLYLAEPLVSAIYVQRLCKAADNVVALLRCEVFRVLLLQRVSFFDSHNSADLTRMVSDELETIRTFVYGNVTRDRGLRALLEALGATGVLFWVSWRLGPVMAAVIIATAATVALYRLQARAAEGGKAAALSRVAAVAQQAFSSIRTVRSYSGEAFERERFVSHVSESFKQGAALANAKATMELLNRSCIHLSLLALYALGGYLVQRSLLPISALLTGIGFTYGLVFATQGVVQTVADLRRVIAAVQRVQSLLRESEPDPAMDVVLPPGAWWEAANGKRQAAPANQTPTSGMHSIAAAERGPLALRDITFAYPLRPNVAVLQGLSLILPRGTITAIVGRSGSGKSTVAALLSRWYQPNSGSITLGGIDATQFSHQEWTRAVAVVTQDPELFSGTISDNIAYGGLYGSAQQQVEEAARAANAHEFITALPAGYDTLVGEGGALLSGGQRQRIAIARALLKDSPILILDEATSALDNTSERLVQAAIERLVAGRTVLVIAHRLSTVQAAHQIVCLEGGRVVEVGTHKELVARQGMYANLVSSQSLTLSGV